MAHLTTTHLRQLPWALFVTCLASACATPAEDSLDSGGFVAVPDATEETAESEEIDETEPDADAASNDEVIQVPDRFALAAEAALWGYPLVVSLRTFQTISSLTGLNTLFWQTSLVAPAVKVIVAPNRDTVYAAAILDLRGEPMALTLPEIAGRYYSFQFLSAWTDAFAYVGTRATDGRAGTWVVVPPGFEGTLPEGVTRIDAPTPQLLLLGRFRAVTEADIAEVLALKDAVLLRPLSALTGAAPSEPPPSLGPPAGSTQAALDAGIGLFDELGDALVANPPPAGVQAERLASYIEHLGIGPGIHPSDTATEEQTATLLSGLGALTAALDDPKAGLETQGAWSFALDAGVYADDALLLRAAIAHRVWAANVAAESVYARATATDAGAPLTGAQALVVSFGPGQLPPVNAFWSLTVYGPDMFLVENDQDRYSLSGDSEGLVFGQDGSLEIAVQPTPPAGSPLANWLPAPVGSYSLMLRFYLPKAPILEGTYEYPTLVPQPP